MSPRKCAISSSTDVLVEARPLRRFFCIASGRLFGPANGCRRSLTVLDAIDPTFVSLLRDKVEPEFLADDTGQKAPHRMLLPFRCGDERRDRCARGRPQHRNDASVFGAGPP